MASRLAKKIRGILESTFPDIRIEDLKRPRGSDTTSGVLIWQGFEPLEQVERQRRVWESLRSALSLDEKRSISLLITLTPDELRSIRAA